MQQFSLGLYVIVLIHPLLKVHKQMLPSSMLFTTYHHGNTANHHSNIYKFPLAAGWNLSLQELKKTVRRSCAP